MLSTAFQAAGLPGMTTAFLILLLEVGARRAEPAGATNRRAGPHVLENLEIFCVGAAAVLDTVLVLVLIEARRSRRTVLPALLLALGIWLWHAGAFSQLLFSETRGSFAGEARSISLAVTAAGLLLIPGGLLHGGALMTLADSAGAMCAFLNLPDGAVGTATIESKTNFLGAVTSGVVRATSTPPCTRVAPAVLVNERVPRTVEPRQYDARVAEGFGSRSAPAAMAIALRPPSARTIA